MPGLAVVDGVAIIPRPEPQPAEAPPRRERVTATASADLAPEQRALLDTIAGTEAPDYHTVYGGRRVDDLSRHPGIDTPIQSGPNAGKTSSAAGRYQFLKSTWDGQARKLGLADFSPESQDFAAWDLAESTYGGGLADALRSGDPAALANVGKRLSGVWTSLPGGIETTTGADRFVRDYRRNLQKYTDPNAIDSPMETIRRLRQTRAQDDGPLVTFHEIEPSALPEPSAPPAAPVPPPGRAPGFVDHLSNLAAGAGDVVKSVGEGVRAIDKGAGFLADNLGFTAAGDALREGGSMVGDWLSEQGQAVTDYFTDPRRMSPEYKARTETPVFDQDWNFNPEAIVPAVERSAAGVVAIGGVGKGAMSGLEALAIEPRLVRWLGKAGVPAKAAKKVAELTTTGVAYGGAEGVYSGALAADEARQEAAATPLQQLLQQPGYVAVLKTLPKEPGKGLARGAKAREIYADMLADEVFQKTAAATGLIGALTGGGVLGALERGGKGGLVRQTLTGAGEEALQEGPQSGFESYIAKDARREFLDPTIKPMEGTLQEAASGAVVGAAMGGALGAGGAVVNPGGGAEAPAGEPRQAGEPDPAAAAPTQTVAQPPSGEPAPEVVQSPAVEPTPAPGGLATAAGRPVAAKLDKVIAAGYTELRTFGDGAEPRHALVNPDTGKLYRLYGKSWPKEQAAEALRYAQETLRARGAPPEPGTLSEHERNNVPPAPAAPMTSETASSAPVSAANHPIEETPWPKKAKAKATAAGSAEPLTEAAAGAEGPAADQPASGGTAGGFRPTEAADVPAIAGGDDAARAERGAGEDVPGSVGALPGTAKGVRGSGKVPPGGLPGAGDRGVGGVAGDASGAAGAGVDRGVGGGALGGAGDLPERYRPYADKIRRAVNPDHVQRDWSRAEDAVDISRRPTGWKFVESNDRLAIINPRTGEQYTYTPEPGSGTDMARGRVVLGGLAADLAASPKASEPGELVVRPLVVRPLVGEAGESTVKKSLPVARDGGAAEAAPAQPWLAAAERGERWDETRWFQSRVRVDVGGGQTQDGTVHSVLRTSSGRPWVEVQIDGQEGTVRVAPERMAVLEVRDSEQPVPAAGEPAGGGTATEFRPTGGEAAAEGEGFDPVAWDKARADKIKASREAGNVHLDKVPPYVETMRGKRVHYVHDPKVMGTIRTVDNDGSVYIDWDEGYSAEKELASPALEGKKTVWRTTLGRGDLKDYALGEPATDEDSSAVAPGEAVADGGTAGAFRTTGAEAATDKDSLTVAPGGAAGGTATAFRPTGGGEAPEPEVLQRIADLVAQAGWAQKGGHLYRTADGKAQRTTWLPKADWWLERPDQTTQKDFEETLRRLQAGEKLSPKQARVYDFLNDLQTIALPAEDLADTGYDELDPALAAEVDALIEEALRALGQAPVDAVVAGASANAVGRGPTVYYLGIKYGLQEAMRGAVQPGDGGANRQAGAGGSAESANDRRQDTQESGRADQDLFPAASSADKAEAARLDLEEARREQQRRSNGLSSPPADDGIFALDNRQVDMADLAGGPTGAAGGTATASRPTGGGEALVALRTVDGNTVRVKQADLDSGRVRLPTYRADGVKKPALIHRDNLDPDGQKAAAAWRDLPSFEGRNGAGYASRASAEAQIKKAGQPVERYDVRQLPDTGRWVATLKGDAAGAAVVKDSLTTGEERPDSGGTAGASRPAGGVEAPELKALQRIADLVAQKGGHLSRTADGKAQRTTWLSKVDWWLGQPDQTIAPPVEDDGPTGAAGGTATASRPAGGGEERPADYGANNKVFTKERAELAREVLRRKLNQMNAGFDPEIAAAGLELAGYHIEAGAREFAAFTRAMVADIGEAVRPYLRSFYESARHAPGLDNTGMTSGPEIDAWLASDKSAEVADTGSEPPVSQGGGTAALAGLVEHLAGRLRNGYTITWRELFAAADEAFGGTQGQGQYAAKEAYDALEVAVNKVLLGGGLEGIILPQLASKPAHARETINKLHGLLDLLPTQTKRDAEMDEFQQFSTPPALAYAANWVANLRTDDVFLEPSAGTGNLAVWAGRAGLPLVLNELSPRRARLLPLLYPDARVFQENAEQLDNVLPDTVRPTVVVMNPPFSSTAGRVRGQRRTANGGRHIEQALHRLAPGGRLVAIVGQGMADDAPAFGDWWRRIKRDYAVRANVGIDGATYAKYGTTFDNRILVIDKSGPTTADPVTGFVADPKDLPALLQEVRDDRPEARVARQAVQQPAAESGGAETTAAAQGAGQRGDTARAKPDAVVAGTTRGDAGTGAGRRGGTAVSADGDRAGTGDAAPARSGGDGGSGAGSGSAEKGGAGGRGVAAGGRAVERDAGDQRPAAIELEEPASGAGAPAERLTDAVFTQYTPQKVRIKGAKPHPGALVESAAMGSIQPVRPTYVPNLPAEVIEQGLLSDAQLEAVVYAGQAHEQMLPSGERRGFFVGDGTGVGKGREIAGIILDNWRRGRKKAVWVSFNAGLLNDAQRDFSGVGGDKDLLFFQGKTKAADALKPKEGILFTSYSTLRGGEKKQVDKPGAALAKTRLQQIVDWLGADFDGVIVFDEAHKMGNATAIKGQRGTARASQQAIAGINLQALLPKARVVYVSATGATEVRNLSYATRLGLWGQGTNFASAAEFVNQITAGGVAAMELVARDMKALGMYIARSLSFDGVTYGRLDHDLTPLQTDIYNELATAWQGVLGRVNEALAETSQDKNSDAKGGAISKFWGSHQRFFNQVITALQMPTVLEDMRRQLADGHSIVVQLVNTNEAEQERQAARAAADDAALEEMDFTPRQTLIEYVRQSFPVQQYEEFSREDGSVSSRPVTDAEGNPVLNKAMVERRGQLIETLEAIRVPGNPLDDIIEAFGDAQVAEVTGRKRRFVRARGADGQFTLQEQKRGAASSQVDAAAFQAGDKRVLIFSDAGGTGYSFHADNTAKNRQKRIHYLLQPGWRADGAMQGTGRSHRTNQAQPPHYVLPTTNLKAQKRFISSIARRMDQMGALTRGQRQATSQGLFNAADNLENDYARMALQNLLWGIDSIPGHSGEEIMTAMGLPYPLSPNYELPMPRFLNRLLSLTMEQQSAVFGRFEELLQQIVEKAIQDGTYETGLENLKAVSVRKLDDQTVFTDERTQAETHVVTLEVEKAIKYYSFADVERNVGSGAIWMRDAKGLPFALFDHGQQLDAEGKPVHRGMLFGPRGRRYVENYAEWREGVKRRWVSGQGQQDIKLADPIEAAEAKRLWGELWPALPKTEKERVVMLTGVLLPIWNRITGNPRIMRTITDEGEMLLGRLLPARQAEAFRQKLGLATAVSRLPVAEQYAAIVGGKSATLADGGRIESARVSNETRLEVKPRGRDWTLARLDELRRRGLIVERINWQERVFIPSGEAGLATFERLTADNPVEEIHGLTGDEAKFSRRGGGEPTAEQLQKEYDGLLLDEGGLPQTDGSVKSRGVSWVPLQGGAQVKSATGNSGAFSPENPDIHYRRGPGATARGNGQAAADQSAAEALNAGLARHFNDPSWEGAYVQGDLPDGLAEFAEATRAAFGAEVVGIMPAGKRFDQFNGIHYRGRNYVNLNANVGFVNVAGHELLHQLKKDRPDLYQWFAAQARGHYRNFAEYRDRLNALLGPGEKPYNTAAVEEELLADFAGDALADPAFLQKLAEADPGRFRRLLNAVRRWLHELAGKLRRAGLESSQYFQDVETLRGHLVQALVAYGQGGAVAVGKVAGPKFSRSAMKSPAANLRRGEQAMNTALLDKRGVSRAMYHPDLGWIDFVWGDNRKGIQHILKQRLEKDGMSADGIYRLLTKEIPRVIATGEVIRGQARDGSERVVMGDLRHEAVLVKNRGGNGWVLSAWEVKTPGAAQKANDFKTATPRAADSSDDTRVAGAVRELSALARRFVKSMDGVADSSMEHDDISFSRRRPDLNTSPAERVRESSQLEDSRAADDPDALAEAAKQELARVDTALAGGGGWKGALKRLDGIGEESFRKLSAKARRAALGALTVHQLVDVGASVLPRMREYLGEMSRMDATRNRLIHESDQLAQQWGKLPKAESARVGYVMHESTIAGVDGAAGEYAPSIDVADAQERIKALGRLQLGAGGDKRIPQWQEERRELQAQVAFEQKREKAWARVQALYDALTPAGQAVYRAVRDYHAAHLDRVEQALVEMIEKTRMTGKQKYAAIQELKQEFETMRVQAPYFPLGRFGDYWVHVAEETNAAGKVVQEREFEKFETYEAAEAFYKEKIAEGRQVARGKQIENLREVDGVSATFVAQVEDLIGELGESNPEVADLRDQVYQLYLRTLPEVSTRKHAIHRGKVAGYAKDALRTFANKAFHDAYAYARIKHGFELRENMEQLRADLEAAGSAGKEQAMRDRRVLLEGFRDEVLAPNMTFRDVKERAMNLDVQAVEVKARAKDRKLTEGEQFVVEEAGRWDQYAAWFGEWHKKRKPKATEIKRMTAEQLERELAALDTRERTLAALRAHPRGSEFGYDLYNELQQAYQWLMNPTTSRWASLLNAVGFGFHLALSPAAWITNATQTPLIAVPYVAGRHGQGKTWAAFKTATGEALQSAAKWQTGKEHRFGIREALTRADEIRAYAEALDRGLIDRGRVMDLIGLAEEGAERSGLFKQFSGAMALGFQEAERLNRETTFMAAYRLERDAGKSFAEAVDYADKVVNEAHFNYTAENRARFMRPSVARVLLQFKSYAQHVTFLQWKMVSQALGKAPTLEAKREARRFLAVQTGLQLAAAGAMGLPLGVWGAMGAAAPGLYAAKRWGYKGALVYTLGLMAAAVGLGADDPDDPVDWWAEFEQGMADWFGPTGGQAVSRGLVNALGGIDLSTRVSMADLWWREIGKDVDDRAYAGELLSQLAGPSIGVGVDALEGVSMAANGHAWRGIERMVPKPVRDQMQALRFAKEGALTMKGDPLINEPTPFEIMARSVGFTPSRLAARYAENRAEQGRQRDIEERRRRVLNTIADALIERSRATARGEPPDGAAVAEALAAARAFNAAQPRLRIGPESIKASMQARRRARARAKHGAFLNRKLGERYDFAGE